MGLVLFRSNLANAQKYSSFYLLKEKFGKGHFLSLSPKSKLPILTMLLPSSIATW